VRPGTQFGDRLRQPERLFGRLFDQKTPTNQVSLATFDGLDFVEQYWLRPELLNRRQQMQLLTSKLCFIGFEQLQLRRGFVSRVEARVVHDLSELLVEAFELVQHVGDRRPNAINDDRAVDMDRVPTVVLMAARTHQVPGVAIATPVEGPTTVPAARMLTGKAGPLSRHIGSRIYASDFLTTVLRVTFSEQ
jgi:hypothetical protein